ncbi:membrane protein [Moraxella bovoculi]|uniref:OmpW/AlkL family protein n=1 Tax=Moraxella bovoculi TaxID=386891 RepID=UPI000624C03F|nr:OmpW family outer membrane protein [Moraxella bovoculi]AKG17109.1 OmpW family protein [Moraxella bovoculi]AKG18866.1 membrane protein [Moraxella bovoculi]NSM10227.1 outer membrane beta-barrel protein [Moraxella bovoculi]
MKLKNIALALVAATATTAAVAAPAGTWTIGAGAAYVDPKSNPGLELSVDEDVRPSVTFEYFPVKNVGIELLAAHPFKHDIESKGEKVGSVKLLPPTLSLQYHFDNGGKVVPFIGAGVNYTTFFKERLAVSDLELKDNWGAAGHVGVDFKLTDRDAVRLDARYIDLKTDVKIDGANKGELDLSPWVYGVSFVKSF